MKLAVLKILICSSKFPLEPEKFSQNYQKFGHVSSKRFAGRGPNVRCCFEELGDVVHRTKMKKPLNKILNAAWRNSLILTL